MMNLEITVISGEGLCMNRNKPIKKNAFVIIRTDSFNEQKTRLDKDGGSYPAWDEKFVMQFPMHAREFIAEVRCKRNGGGDRIIGTARIPASDFLGGFVPENYLHFLSYRLRDSKGERNGIINLSVRVKSSAPVNGGYGGGAAAIAKPATSCSQQQQWQPWSSGIAVGDKVSSVGMVTGIPVWS
ncbi:hypothetical protein ACH5RR_000229 [Cinchona calisaya]|uniref:C2 domain-containing protein n=1 Tax=Cinchona calisaya TaxID=153742 RepID=A0ABD3B0H8_9GENT